MDDLETRLAAAFAHQVRQTPGMSHLAEAAARRGRQARRRRTAVAGLSVLVLAVGALSAIVPLTGSSSPLVPGGPRSYPFPSDPQRGSADADWVSGLLPRGSSSTLATTVLASGRVFRPDSTSPVKGVNQVVHAATPLPDGSLLLSTTPAGASSTSLVRLRPDGSQEVLDQDVSSQHAVDAGRTRVAYGYRHSGRVVVRDLATGGRRDEITVPGEDAVASPIGLVGEEVLMTVGDKHPVAEVWNTRTGTVLPIRPSREKYRALLGATTDGAWVALRKGAGQGDKDTFGVVNRESGKANNESCCVFGGFSPDDRQALMAPGPRQGGNEYATHEIDGPGTGAAQLPYLGVLAVGWSDDSTLAAVVRAPDPKKGDLVLMVVTCPTTGTACTLQGQVPDSRQAFVVNARR